MEQTPPAGQTSNLPGLEGIFDTYLRIKSPVQLPEKAREWIVKYGPWISLVLLIISGLVLIPLLIIALGMTAVTLPFAALAGATATTMWGWVHIALSLVVIVMEAIAIPALLKRKLSGWKMIYYASLLSFVSSVLGMAWVSAIVGLIIGMFILFQIRSKYQ